MRAQTARCACIIPCRKTTTELGVPPRTGGRSRNVSGSPLGSSAWRSTKPDRAAACAARERIAASASADDDNARRVDAGNRTRYHGRIRVFLAHTCALAQCSRSRELRKSTIQARDLYRAGWATCSWVFWAKRSPQTSGIWCNLHYKLLIRMSNVASCVRAWRRRFLSLLIPVLGCGASQVTASDSIAGGVAVWDSVCRHKL